MSHQKLFQPTPIRTKQMILDLLNTTGTQKSNGELDFLIDDNNTSIIANLAIMRKAISAPTTPGELQRIKEMNDLRKVLREDRNQRNLGSYSMGKKTIEELLDEQCLDDVLQIQQQS